MWIIPVDPMSVCSTLIPKYMFGRLRGESFPLRELSGLAICLLHIGGSVVFQRDSDFSGETVFGVGLNLSRVPAMLSFELYVFSFQ